VTRRLLVLGSPVSHSLSPQIHNAAMRDLGLDATYVAMEVDGSGMARVAREMRQGAFHGANITMPHKTLAAELVDQLDPTAIAVDAVNTWVVEANHIVGYSTDTDGVLHAWTRAGLPSDGPVVVLGAGGASRAALHALKQTHDVWMSARRPDALKAFGFEGAKGFIPWGSTVPDAVVVNATPLGMRRGSLPGGLLDDASGYFEMVYSTLTTAEQAAHAMGLPVAKGVDMLIGQAMASFRLWFGVEPRENVMIAALTP
jgi:shikimate dehydrogenase